MVSQLRVSQIILAATFDLTQTSYAPLFGQLWWFCFLPYLEGLLCLNSRTLENSKEPVRLRVLHPFSEWTKADLNSQPQRSRQELKPLQGISVYFFSRNYTISSTQQKHILRLTFGNNSKNYSNRWCHNSVYPK